MFFLIQDSLIPQAQIEARKPENEEAKAGL